MKAAPPITVIMPTYNAAAYLDQSVRSILDQTYGDFEFLILDDGSSDQSLEILHELARQDKRITLISGAHQGLPALLNRGLNATSSEFVARMDADDISLPHRFEKQIAFLKDNRQVVVVGGWAQLFTNAGPLEEMTAHTEDARAELHHHCTLVHPSTMMRRREICEIGGYRQSFFPSEDYDLWLRLAPKYELRNIPEILLHYRIHEKQASVVRREDQVFCSLVARRAALFRERGAKDTPEISVTSSWETLYQMGMDPSEVDTSVLKIFLYKIWNLGIVGNLSAAEEVAKVLVGIKMTPALHRLKMAELNYTFGRWYFARRRWGRGVGCLARACLNRPDYLVRLLQALTRRVLKKTDGKDEKMSNPSKKVSGDMLAD